MTVNYIQKGDVLDYANSGNDAIEAGDVVVIVSGASGRVGIAAGNIAAGKTGAVAVSGVYEFPKATGAITLGASAYWDATNKKVTTTSTNNTLIGWAVAAAASADASAKIKLQ